MEEAWKKSLRVVLETLNEFRPDDIHDPWHFHGLYLELKTTVDKLIHEPIAEENGSWSDMKVSLWRVANASKQVGLMPDLLGKLYDNIFFHLLIWDTMQTWHDRREHIVSLLRMIGHSLKDLNPLHYSSFLGPHSPDLVRKIGRALRRASTVIMDEGMEED